VVSDDGWCQGGRQTLCPRRGARLRRRAPATWCARHAAAVGRPSVRPVCHPSACGHDHKIARARFAGGGDSGRLQRGVPRGNGRTKAVVAKCRCRPRVGSVDLVRRMAKHVPLVYDDEHNTSQTCAECSHGLCNTYVSPDSPVDLTPLKAKSTYAQRASASAAKRASPLRDGRRARRGVMNGIRSGPRDSAAAQRAKEHAGVVRTKVLQAIAAHGMWEFGTDPLALWGVKLCTNVACSAT